MKQSLFWILCFISLRLSAGWVITEVTTDRFGNQQVQTLYIEGDKIRFENRQYVQILDLQSKEITLIYPSNQVFWRGNTQDVREGTLVAMEKEKDMMLKDAPPDQKEAYIELYEKIKVQLMEIDTTFASSLPVRIIKMDSSCKFNQDYSTSAFQVFVGDTLIEEVCIANDWFPISDGQMKKLLRLTKEMTPTRGLAGYRYHPAYVSMLEKGYSVNVTRIIGEYQLSEVTEYLEVTIPELFFDPPKGYRRLSIEELSVLELQGDVDSIGPLFEND